MGLFLEHTSPSPGMTSVVRSALAADPAKADDPAVVEAVAASAQDAKSGPVVVKVTRIVTGFLIGAALLAVGLLLVYLGDQQAIEQAKLAVTMPGYTPPTLGISAAGTSVITLAGAWSAALVGVIISEK